MSRDDLEAEIVRILGEAFELAPSEVIPSAHLIDDLGLDSIDAIDISVRTRELAGRKMSDEELRALRTVADVVERVWQIRAQGLAPRREP
ncbi:MAG: acyl carrier protein [Myxococcales bacterium]|nr:acyl carrier protein [Myxococcales bacterium]